MTLSQEEENKNRIISLGISLSVFTLLLLFFIFYTIFTPNPPFPETMEAGGGSSGIEFNIGNMIEGTGNVDPSNGIGEAVKVVESTEVTPPNPTNSEEYVTSDNGEDSDIKKNEKSTQTTVVIPVKPKEKTMAEKIAEAAKKNNSKNGGGDGNSGQAGDEGRPDGKPNVNGNGGSGGDGTNGTGGGEGGGDGPGKGTGKGPGISFNLGNRKIMTPPPSSKDTQEEGTVVVEITVDKTGKVIKAEPTGRGTNTNSAVLKTKARQAALATKFNVSGEFEEQKGTITIVFKF
jgi:TonB family protein